MSSLLILNLILSVYWCLFLAFQNLSDMAEVPHVEEDLVIMKEIAAQTLMYKAYR